MESLFKILVLLVFIWLIIEMRKLKKSIPKLNTGERIAVVPKEHSNVSVVRKGDSVILTDEEFIELDINKIVR
jgi:hypothetical protein